MNTRQQNQVNIHVRYYLVCVQSFKEDAAICESSRVTRFNNVLNVSLAAVEVKALRLTPEVVALL